MTEAAKQPSMTVMFERKIKPADYEGMTASIFISDTIPDGASPDEIDALARSLFLQARSAVYEQLDMSFSINERKVIEEDPRTVAQAVENVVAVMPGSAPVPSAPTAPAPVPYPPGNTQPISPPSAPAAAQGYAETPSCPKCHGKMYDNTAENAWKRGAVRQDGGTGYKLGPDFKCMNRDGCGAAIWPTDFDVYKPMPAWNRSNGTPWKA